MSDPHRAQLEGNRARLAAQLDTLREHAEQAAHKLLELERAGTDPRLLAFAEEASAMLEDRCYTLARAITAIDDELGEKS